MTPLNATTWERILLLALVMLMGTIVGTLALLVWTGWWTQVARLL